MKNEINKRNTFKQKTNNLTSDPRYKELEHIPLEKIKIEKERTQRHYYQLQKELENIKEDFFKTTIRAEDREKELRNNINTLLLKYRIKDTDITIASINELYSQIATNVKSLEQQNDIAIQEKKKEMEDRIKMRILDSDTNYYKELNKKVNEQKSMLRALHEFTIDMQNINKNYNAVKLKAELYSKENESLKQDLLRADHLNEDVKLEIMRLKHINSKLEDKVNAYKCDKKKDDNEDKDIIMKKKKSVPMVLSASTSCGTILKNKTFDSKITMEKIIKLLSNKDFLRQYSKESHALLQLINIFDQITDKIKKLDKEYYILIENHPVYDRLFDILNLQLKEDEAAEKAQGRRKSDIEKSLGNFSVTMKKNQRKQFIESVIKDRQIHQSVYNDKFPNILNIDRQLG